MMSQLYFTKLEIIGNVKSLQLMEMSVEALWVFILLVKRKG